MAKINLSEIINSKEYGEASKKSGAWKLRIPFADSKELGIIEKEKRAFFSKMRISRPDLYRLFKIDDKSLTEALIKKRTGKDVIIF